MTFDDKGNILKSNSVFNSWENVIESSQKILSFIDCPGFDKYTSNNLQNLLSFNPDYSLLVVSAIKKCSEIQEQIKLAIALHSYFWIVITHIDESSTKILNDVLKTVS